MILSFATRCGLSLRMSALVACAIAPIFIPMAPAQQPQKKGQASGVDHDKQQFRVFPLNHADAESIRDAIAPITNRSGSTVTASGPTNRIVVRADAEAMEEIEQLIKSLDIPIERQDREGLETKIFRLKNIALNPALRDQLQVAVSNQGRLAIDPLNNSVVVQDRRESLATIEALLRDLDRETGEKSPASTLRLRLIWLVSGMERKASTPVPADLKNVISDLSRFGIDGLQLAAQTIVQTVPNDQFRIECSPEMDNPCELSISGTFLNKPNDARTLQLQVTATEQVQPGGIGGGGGGFGGGGFLVRNLCNLNTTVTVPPGRTVVLGATPVRKMTSVFVLQVTPE
jgi:hypothetical protein